MFRFSLAGLLLFTVAVAVGCAALVNATDVWRQAIITVTVLSLLFATVASLFASENARAFAGGFALVGWLYFVLAFVSHLGLRDDLLTERATAWLGTKIHGNLLTQPANFAFAPSAVLIGNGSPSSALTTGQLQIWNTTSGISLLSSGSSAPAFHDIGHSLWTLILACLGGIFACYLARRKKAENKADA